MFTNLKIAEDLKQEIKSFRSDYNFFKNGGKYSFLS